MALKIKKSKKSWARDIVPLIIAFALLGGGIYTLWLTFSPMLAIQLTNPTDNSTIQLLQKTEKKIEGDRLYIPKIDINLPYASGDESVMEHGAWWRQPQNGNPADGGNFTLSAHRFVMGLTPEQTQRKSPFYNIDKLKIDDELIVDYKGKRYVYVIRKIFAVKPTAIEIENRTAEPQLTLYSCTLGGAADGREVLIATLKDQTTDQSTTKNPALKN